MCKGEHEFEVLWQLKGGGYGAETSNDVDVINKALDGLEDIKDTVSDA